MNFNLIQSWQYVLKEEFEKPYYKDLLSFLKSEYEQFQIFPKQENVFAAFNFTPFEKVKVVLIGQDPYPNENQANGLCFSVNAGVPLPPSLSNIFKELSDDLKIVPPVSGDLSNWAKQGVLMLNTTLTVRCRQAKSHHGKGWEKFTDEVIRKISKNCENIIFLLWGNDAKKKAKIIDSESHYILNSGHPSPLSANKGHWFGNKHFSKTNDILKQLGKTPVNFNGCKV